MKRLVLTLILAAAAISIGSSLRASSLSRVPSSPNLVAPVAPAAETKVYVVFRGLVAWAEYPDGMAALLVDAPSNPSHAQLVHVRDAMVNGSAASTLGLSPGERFRLRFAWGPVQSARLVLHPGDSKSPYGATNCGALRWPRTPGNTDEARAFCWLHSLRDVMPWRPSVEKSHFDPNNVLRKPSSWVRAQVLVNHGQLATYRFATYKDRSNQELSRLEFRNLAQKVPDRAIASQMILELTAPAGAKLKVHVDYIDRNQNLATAFNVIEVTPKTNGAPAWIIIDNLTPRPTGNAPAAPHYTHFYDLLTNNTRPTHRALPYAHDQLPFQPDTGYPNIPPPAIPSPNNRPICPGSCPGCS